MGYSHETALLNARRKMGNTALMTEYSRDAWIVGWVDTLIRDVRYACRSFARNPGSSYSRSGPLVHFADDLVRVVVVIGK